ncbi:flagellar protein FlaG [Paenibacillus sp. Marseille-Q7038]
MNIQFSLSGNNVQTSVSNQGNHQSNLNKESQSVPEDGTTHPANQFQQEKLEKVFKAIAGPETILDINVHEKTHQIMVKVLDKETGKVIREVPPEKLVDLVATMIESTGIIVDKKM